MTTPNNNHEKETANRDPLTGTPGAHPVSVGVGAAAGGVAGGAVGSFGGPVGTAVGVGVGAVVGGLAGKGAAEQLDPTFEDEYWSRNYILKPYVEPGATYESYRPAYRFGWDCANRYRGKSYEEIEAALERDWRSQHEPTSLQWEKAKHAIKDAWGRHCECRA